MRVRDDIDERCCPSCTTQYLNVEEDSSETSSRVGRRSLAGVVQEGVLSDENALHVLDFERASHIIESSSHGRSVPATVATRCITSIAPATPRSRSV